MDEEVRRALFYGLCGTDGEEQYDAGLCTRIWQTDGKTYVLLQNESERLHTVRLSVEGKFAVQYLGTDGALSDGVLSCSVLPGALYFFELSDTAKPGLYDGDVKCTSIYEGEFSLRGVSSAALYTEMADGKLELIQIWKTEKIILSNLHDQSRIKLFYWDIPLSPVQESQSLYALREK